MSRNIETLKTEILHNFGTPCCVVDLSKIEKNIRRAQKLCDKAHVLNRPHIKTHKSSFLAKKQIANGAIGITCQKVGEAEVMVNAGISDIVIATNVLGAAKSGRLDKLHRRASLKLSADNEFVLDTYSEVARRENKVIHVLLECDTGRKRAGVETPEEMLSLARKIKADPNLNFAGLLFYPPVNGWVKTQEFLDNATIGFESLRIKSDIISTGGTPNLLSLGKLKGATEHRSGTCIFNDLMMVEAGFSKLEDCALTVFTSVVSRAGHNRGILDAGSKSLTSDTGSLEGFGYILEYPNAKIVKLAEEHGFLELSDCAVKPNVGDVVRVLPNHVCVVVNMFDKLVAIRDGVIIDVISVEARGMLV